VIVFVGSPTGRIVDGRITLAGTAARAARAASAAGAEVQLVGRVGDDPSADTLLLALATAGVGHVAILRDPSRATPIIAELTSDEGFDELDEDGPRDERVADDGRPIELDAGDVELGLRYLTDFRVLVLVPPATDQVTRVAIDGAGWASASVVLVVDREAGQGIELPRDAIVLEAPADDPDGAFATVVGRLAAALDAGGTPGEAFAQVVDGAGWTSASGA